MRNFYLENGVITDGSHYYPIGHIQKRWDCPVTYEPSRFIPWGLIDAIINSKMPAEELTLLYTRMHDVMVNNDILFNNNSCLKLISKAVLIRACISPEFNDDDAEETEDEYEF
jgi:hypothetical protein